MNESTRKFVTGSIRPSFYRQAERYLLWLGLIIVALHGYLQDLHQRNYIERHFAEEKLEFHKIKDMETHIAELQERAEHCVNMRLTKAPPCK